jgi:hypothetical protein
MAISRRAFGLGLLAASAAGTGGYVYLRQHPEIAGRFGEPKPLFGFAGGEKEGFLANTNVRSVLERRFGLILDARAAPAPWKWCASARCSTRSRSSCGHPPPCWSMSRAPPASRFPATR